MVRTEIWMVRERGRESEAQRRKEGDTQTVREREKQTESGRDTLF